MKMNRMAGATAVVGALGAVVLGFGAGTAGAAPGPGMPGPGPHIVGGFGHGHLLPPGQIKRVCPWQAPPGYWVGGPHGVPCT